MRDRAAHCAIAERDFDQLPLPNLRVAELTAGAHHVSALGAAASTGASVVLSQTTAAAAAKMDRFAESGRLVKLGIVELPQPCKIRRDGVEFRRPKDPVGRHVIAGLHALIV